MARGIHPPGRRRLRSAVRPDGYETWTIESEQYEVLREFILETIADLDVGDGVLLKTLIEVAELQLAGHPRFSSGRFTNWIRFVKVDLECEGVVERVGPKSPQRVRLTERGT
ncbi:MAG: hypothetical protein MUF33_03155 [Candidatus Nanopelagicales bacterium]|nr:hypothetical protein [Candidatus Nanopelagicales bacterium]